MSFSTDVKKEICAVPTKKMCCTSMLATAFILSCGVVDMDRIRIKSDTLSILQYIRKLIHKDYEIATIIEDIQITGEKSFAIYFDAGNMAKLHSLFGIYIENGKIASTPKIPIERMKDCCKISAVKGAFLACGTINNPHKGYHMEFLCKHIQFENMLYLIFEEMGVAPKIASRAGVHSIYFKTNETIADILQLLSATKASLLLAEVSITKSFSNDVNREANCTAANYDKQMSASVEQVKAIQWIRDNIGIDKLDEKLYETAIARLNNPYMSLEELAEVQSPPISKSGIAHRIRKIMEIKEQNEG